MHALEREVDIATTKLEETEGELRQQQMAAAMRHLRGEDAEAGGVDAAGMHVSSAVADGALIEDRRATSPFVKELSTDARKSLTRILGITQILKHKKDGKEQAQLVRQLTVHTRRLEHTVADLADADRLVRGEMELSVRRTDLEALVKRVVDESGIDADHELQVVTERVVVAIDQLRTEQILAGLLRTSGDRTPPKKAITVRLGPSEGGALITVEDPEPSSDASLSPVVTRFAEAQGGWTTVESRDDGGSSFKVFLPDGAGRNGPRTGLSGDGGHRRGAAHRRRRRRAVVQRGGLGARAGTAPALHGRGLSPGRVGGGGEGGAPATVRRETSGGRRSAPAQHEGVALAAAATDRHGPDVGSSPAHLHRGRQHQAGPARTDRVAERHRAAVDVHDRLLDVEHAARVHGHRRERLVHLDHAEVGGHDAGLLQRPLEREGGHGLQRCVPVRRHAEGDDLRDRLSPSCSARASLITTSAAAPSEICDALPAVTVPSSVNAGRRPANPSTVVSARMPSSRSS